MASLADAVRYGAVVLLSLVASIVKTNVWFWFCDVVFLSLLF